MQCRCMNGNSEADNNLPWHMEQEVFWGKICVFKKSPCLFDSTVLRMSLIFDWIQEVREEKQCLRYSFKKFDDNTELEVLGYSCQLRAFLGYKRFNCLCSWIGKVKNRKEFTHLILKHRFPDLLLCVFIKAVSSA